MKMELPIEKGMMASFTWNTLMGSLMIKELDLLTLRKEMYWKINFTSITIPPAVRMIINQVPATLASS
jgi:hypothetical protein